ncbi:hypothetical protein [Vibrio sp. MEBiC08052]|uniref:hypothetical protein n=1 Tax=Vibrio sp. MEBiC08052 TaxID=1761910 RepID=UPI0007407B47|nr:hypothetical protein [Vibrio sp. MEBiC08052]KUI97883.1 hypothetical protein VRK_25840 [Vibrio sp. MEBiC08052]
MTDTSKLLQQVEKAFKPKPPKQQQKLNPEQLAQMAKVKSSIHLFRLKLATLDRVKDESDKLIQELIKTFIQQIPKQIEQATSGLAQNVDVHASAQHDLSPDPVGEQAVEQSYKSDREPHDTEHSDG